MKGHLRELELKNFQKHSSLKLELTPGLNIVAGPTDSGKSSIFRAIRWLLTNRPRGIDAYRTYRSQGPISVSMVFEDGEVKRIKGAKENDYILKIGDEVTTFSTVKTDVPLEVKEFLKIPDFVLQGQHDQYYLLQSSPGEVVREIQKLVDLDIISSVIQMANQHINTCKANLRAYQKTKEEYEQELDRLAGIPDLMKEVEFIEAQQAILEDKRKRLEEVENLVEKIEECEDEIESLRNVMIFKSKVESLHGQAEQLHEKKVKLNEAKNLLRSLVDVYKEIGKYRIEIETLLAEFEGISKMVGGVCPLCNGTGKVTL